MSEETLVQLEKTSKLTEEVFDIAIIGAGPAGLSAALCAGRAKLNVLLIDRTLPGGTTSTACLIDNYLGFPGGILGEDLTKRMESHVTAYGTNYTCETVEDIINIDEKVKVIKTDLENQYKAKTIILATGLEPKKLESKFERRFLGRGLSYYAKSDALFYAGKDVAVIGGGNCACYAADYLSNYVNKIYLIHRSGSIKAVRSLKSKIQNNPIIDTIWDSKLVDIFGVEKIEKIKLFNMVTNQYTWLDIKGLFVYDGRYPSQEVIHPAVDLDEGRHIITDDCMRTNIPGIYAAGDIRAKQIRQIPTAVADGMIAAINAERDFLRY
jgi:thioredoxin reductase (NADPH)